MADTEQYNPMNQSSDHRAMSRFWRIVSAVLEGVEAMRNHGYHHNHYIPGPVHAVAQLNELQRSPITERHFQSHFLPKFPNETIFDYELRRCHAPLTNIYEDISANLASKPFAKELELYEDTPDQYKKLAENIDGQGNNLHVFASEVFKAGIDFGVDWILVDYTKVPQGVTLADERNMGARPYWVRIPAERMRAVYSDFLNGQEIIVHARIYEPSVRRADYSEVCVERVRIFNREPVFALDDNGQQTDQIISYAPATWEIQEEVVTRDGDGKDSKAWVTVGQGPVTIGEIPLVPFIPKGRRGNHWRVDPPLRGIAHMQVEEFQQESNLKTIKELTAFPMLAILGAPPLAPGKKREIQVGPKAALCIEFGADGTVPSASFIEPSATSLTFLQSDLEKLRTEMRDLGMQPLATANLTVVTTANIAMKAHSAVQAWAIRFKDSLERAWKLTAMWLNSKDEPEVHIHTEFGPDFETRTELAELNKATWLSDQNKAAEFKRRGALGDDFDWDENEQQLAEEQSNNTLTPEKMIDPVTGMPVVVTPEHGVLNPPPPPVKKPVFN